MRTLFLLNSLLLLAYSLAVSPSVGSDAAGSEYAHERQGFFGLTLPRGETLSASRLAMAMTQHLTSDVGEVTSKILKQKDQLLIWMDGYIRENPDLHTMASSLLREKILAQTGLQVDPDQTWYVGFQELRYRMGSKDPEKTTYSQETITNLKHLGPPAFHRTLTECLLKNFPLLGDDGHETWDGFSLYTYTGIYKEAIADVYDHRNEIRILPHVLRKIVWDVDFQTYAEKRLQKSFEHDDDHIKYEFISCMFGLSSSTLSSAAKRDVLTGVNLTKSQGVTVSRLRVKSYAAPIAFVFSNLTTNGIVLYMRNAPTKFTYFGSINEMRRWFAERSSLSKQRATIASHFSMWDVQTGPLYSGVKSWLESCRVQDVIDFQSIDFQGQTFFAMLVDSLQEKQLSDVKVLVKSDSEVVLDAVVDGVDAIFESFGDPVSAIAALVMHIVHASCAESPEERSQEVTKLLWDVGNVIAIVALDAAVRLNLNGEELIAKASETCAEVLEATESFELAEISPKNLPSEEAIKFISEGTVASPTTRVKPLSNTGLLYDEDGRLFIQIHDTYVEVSHSHENMYRIQSAKTGESAMLAYEEGQLHPEGCLSKEARKKMTPDLYATDVNPDELESLNIAGLFRKKNHKLLIRDRGRFIRVSHLDENRYQIRAENRKTEGLILRWEDGKFRLEGKLERIEHLRKFGLSGGAAKQTDEAIELYYRQRALETSSQYDFPIDGQFNLDRYIRDFQELHAPPVWAEACRIGGSRTSRPQHLITAKPYTGAEDLTIQLGEPTATVGTETYYLDANNYHFLYRKIQPEPPSVGGGYSQVVIQKYVATMMGYRNIYGSETANILIGPNQEIYLWTRRVQGRPMPEINGVLPLRALSAWEDFDKSLLTGSIVPDMIHEANIFWDGEFWFLGDLRACVGDELTDPAKLVSRRLRMYVLKREVVKKIDPDVAIPAEMPKQVLENFLSDDVAASTLDDHRFLKGGRLSPQWFARDFELLRQKPRWSIMFERNRLYTSPYDYPRIHWGDAIDVGQQMKYFVDADDERFLIVHYFITDPIEIQVQTERFHGFRKFYGPQSIQIHQAEPGDFYLRYLALPGRAIVTLPSDIFPRDALFRLEILFDDLKEANIDLQFIDPTNVLWDGQMYFPTELHILPEGNSQTTTAFDNHLLHREITQRMDEEPGVFAKVPSSFSKLIAGRSGAQKVTKRRSKQ